MIIHANPMHFPFDPNALAAEGEPAATGSDTEPGTTPGTEPLPTNLTPDALLLYCQARLDGLDSQIQQDMQSQQVTNADQQDLTPVQTALAKYADGCTDPASVEDLASKLQTAINVIESRDPGSRALSQLKDMLSTIKTGQAKLSPVVQTMLQIDQQRGITVETPPILSAGQIKGLTDTLSQVTSSESSSAELNMINLQSLMSQRQTAVELTTNMMQTLDDTLSKVVANVGH